MPRGHRPHPTAYAALQMNPNEILYEDEHENYKPLSEAVTRTLFARSVVMNDTKCLSA